MRGVLIRGIVAIAAGTQLVAQQPPAGGFARPDAAALLRSMSLEEQAGQLFMAWILSREDGQEEMRAALRALVAAGAVGGVVLSTGDMRAARGLIAELQGAARVPLIIAGDFETGLTMRLQDAPHLGNAMLLGATGSSRLSHDVGAAIGAAGQVLGFHWCFGPVLDVNDNPQNPIINVRSFGGDPQLVARLGAAQIRGMQPYMLATAKHFPGHGDVSTDSHLELPTVGGDRARLEAVELVPFKRAVEAGVGAIMTAHLAVPALDPRPRLPATLSQPILTGLLRETLGFEGIIVTDALEMGGVTKVVDQDEAVLGALRAGADLLLMPLDPVRARRVVVEAVRGGKVPRARFDAAVGRVLAAKQRYVQVGLERDPLIGLPPETWAAQRALGAEIARRGVTLVRDRLGVLPLVRGRKVYQLDVLDRAGPEGEVLAAQLGAQVAGHRRLHPETPAAEIEAALQEAAAAEVLLVGMHLKVRAFSGRIGVPERLRGVVELLRKHPRAIAVAFGNPYVIRDFDGVSTYVCAYDRGAVIESAVAAALVGAAPVTGRLPIEIPDVAPLGAGLSLYSGLADGDPEHEGLAGDLSGRIAALLTRKVEEKVFPGAVAMVTRRGRIVARVAVGRESYAADAPPVTIATRYDLASLTKVCGTLPALAVLLERGAVSLDDKLQKWVPAFQGEGKERVTLRHVVAHAAGLMWWVPFYKTLKGKAEVVEAAAKYPLQWDTGTKFRYSDLGLILTMAVVEKASGKPLDRFLAEDVYPKIGVKAVFSHTGDPIAAAPTETDAWRGRTVQGEVHDENAFAMGGVSGHAGLFGTVEDVARVGNVFLGGGGGLIRGPLARRLCRRLGVVDGNSRAVLWDTFVAGGSGGSGLSGAAFGHTGFTGTSVWCDPATDLCMVLLTNRVHPTRDNPRIARARREFCDLVVGALER